MTHITTSSGVPGPWEFPAFDPFNFGSTTDELARRPDLDFSFATCRWSVRVRDLMK